MTRGREEVLWLFDLGNTRLKAAWSRGDESGALPGIDWEAAQPGTSLGEQVAAWPSPDRILVASVASSARAAPLRQVLDRRAQVPAEWLVSPASACGIHNGYRVPARLGVDRFLAMAGARAMAPDEPFVIVACGTALTLDAVDAGGRHDEGLIVPAPDLMIRSLRTGTAIGETNPDAFRQDGPDDTRAAIHAGCWRAAVALVDAVCARHRAEWGGLTLWLHGGGAPALQAALAEHGSARPQRLDDAVWRGMRAWAAATPAPAHT